MTIETVNYKQKFYTFQFLNCDIGFDCSLDKGEDPMDALKKMKIIAEQFHRQEFPHLYTENGTQITQSPDLIYSTVEKLNGKDDLATHINTCQEIKVLETYKLLVKGNPELQELYDKKFAELSK